MATDAGASETVASMKEQGELAVSVWMWRLWHKLRVCCRGVRLGRRCTCLSRQGSAVRTGFSAVKEQESLLQELGWWPRGHRPPARPAPHSVISRGGAPAASGTRWRCCSCHIPVNEFCLVLKDRRVALPPYIALAQRNMGMSFGPASTPTAPNTVCLGGHTGNTVCGGAHGIF